MAPDRTSAFNHCRSEGPPFDSGRLCSDVVYPEWRGSWSRPWWL